MSLTENDELFMKGIAAVEKGHWLAALVCFEKLVQLDDRPVYNSYFAASIAKERGQFSQAALLCRDAMAREPENPVHWLNLGRIFLFQGRKIEAINTFREGLKHNSDPRIITELQKLGTRKQPVIPFLHRNNPFNKMLGVIFQSLKLR
jgi:predicted Zn-dependent protease